jgi:hypothetical protein
VRRVKPNESTALPRFATAGPRFPFRVHAALPVALTTLPCSMKSPLAVAGRGSGLPPAAVRRCFGSPAYERGYRKNADGEGLRAALVRGGRLRALAAPSSAQGVFGEAPRAQSALVRIAFADDEHPTAPVRRPRGLKHAPFADLPVMIRSAALRNWARDEGTSARGPVQAHSRCSRSSGGGARPQ